MREPNNPTKVGIINRLFLASLFACTLILKLSIIQTATHPIITPDENTYSTPPTSILDLGAYSITSPYLDYHQALALNAILTTLTIFPINALLQRNHPTKQAATLTTLISLAGPLWAYSFVNMAEAAVILLTLLAAQYRALSILPALIKLAGIASLIATSNPALSLGGGLAAISLAFNPNAGPELIRMAAYALTATAGLALFTRGHSLRLLLAFLSIALIAFAYYSVPTTYAYGRYIDAGLIAVLATTHYGSNRNTIIGLSAASLAFLYFHFCFNPAPFLDSGAYPFIIPILKRIKL